LSLKAGAKAPAFFLALKHHRTCAPDRGLAKWNPTPSDAFKERVRGGRDALHHPAITLLVRRLRDGFA
jgi:hypothetical protein